MCARSLFFLSLSRRNAAGIMDGIFHPHPLTDCIIHYIRCESEENYPINEVTFAPCDLRCAIISPHKGTTTLNV